MPGGAGSCHRVPEGARRANPRDQEPTPGRQRAAALGAGEAAKPLDIHVHQEEHENVVTNTKVERAPRAPTKGGTKGGTKVPTKGSTKGRVKGRAKRTYNSELRKEHAEKTAERVLDALGERVRLGDRELSYAAIAKQARVSVPTVYRHFPTRGELVRAFIARQERGLLPSGGVESLSIEEGVRRFFGRFDDSDDLMSAGRPGQMWELSRLGTVPRRRAMLEARVDAECRGLGEPERTWLVDTLVVLFSSATGEAFRGYLERSGAETAERVLFAMEALLRHGKALAKKGKSR